MKVLISTLLSLHCLHAAVLDPTCMQLLNVGEISVSNLNSLKCDIHSYGQNDARQCFLQHSTNNNQENYLLFIGDSTILKMYGGIRNTLLDRKIDRTIWKQDYTFKDKSIKTYMEFYPADTSTEILQVLNSKLTNTSEKSPNYIVAGVPFNLRYTFNGILEDYMLFQSNLMDLRDLLSDLKFKESIWVINKIDGYSNPYNRRAKRILKDTEFSIMKETNLVDKQSLAGSNQVLANYLCNRVIDYGKKSCCGNTSACCKVSQTTTCCAKMPAMTLEQLTLFHENLFWSVFLGLLGITITLKIIIFLKKGRKDINKQGNRLEKMMLIFSTLSIMLYIYLCDRSGIVRTEEKPIRKTGFYIGLFIAAILGLLTIKRANKDEVLSKDQSDEWKGWVQIVVLLYHYTGANLNLTLYSTGHFLTSTYLFISGYSHTCFYLNQQSINHKKALQVIFRLNFLVMCLCVTMYHSYQYYYFAPLITFWYLVVYAVCCVTNYITGEKGNHVKTFSAVLGTTFILVTIMYKFQVIFDIIFGTPPISYIVAPTDQYIYEWWVRSSTDRYTCLYGSSFAVFIYVIKPQTLLNYNHQFRTTVLAITASWTLLVCVEYNIIHPYLSALPVLSFVVLRNINSSIRCYNSMFFIWIGKMSLELYLCQYHIWLASGSKDLLVIIPNNFLLNFVLTTVLFVFTAHHAKNVSNFWSDYLFNY